MLRQPGKTQQGIRALVTLLAPETTVRVSPYSLRPVAISQPLGFYGDDDFFWTAIRRWVTKRWMPAASSSSPLPPTIPRRRRAGSLTARCFGLSHPAAGIPRLAIPGQHHPDRADPTAGCPAAGDEPFWLGMNGVLGVGEGESEGDIPQTFTTELGTYTGLQPATFLQGNRRVTYKFD
ncbi:hypothetical protein KPZU09_18690 [Klebsiella pneumoniae]|uniref:Type VI secretion protein n=1 Tax=Klebsiella pneumoniae TaxID=573 RepID=A0A919HRG7_KLEPN|nr:hypothetical protein KPZU09_18690 [Klebsiella pneumoniae]